MGGAVSVRDVVAECVRVGGYLGVWWYMSVGGDDMERAVWINVYICSSAVLWSLLVDKT